MPIKYSKILIIFLTIIFIVMSVGLISPNKIHAYWGVEDTNVTDPVVFAELPIIGAASVATKASAATAATATTGNWTETIANWATQVAKWAKDELLKTLRDVIAKKLIDYTVNQAIQWIQGGGDPKFVTDWQGLLTRTGQDVTGQVISQLGGINICSPFKSAVINSTRIMAPYGGSSINRALSCPYGQIGVNLADFYRNFGNGGWKAYSAMWQPGGNYYSATLMSYDYMLSRTNAAVTAKTNEAIAGSGYLSATKEVKAEGKPSSRPQRSAPGWLTSLLNNPNKDSSGEYSVEKGFGGPDDPTNPSTGYILKNEKLGASYEVIFNNETGGTTINTYKDGKSLGEVSYQDSPDLFNKLSFEAANNYANEARTMEQISDVGGYVKNVINTPGDTIGKTIADSITSDYQWSANIQSWVSALVNAAISRLMREGLSAMQSSDEAEKSSNAIPWYPDEYKSIAQNEMVQSNQQLIDQIKKFTGAWQYILNIKRKALVASESIVKIFEDMKKNNCQVTDSEIANAKSERDRLKNEVVSFEAKIAEGNQVISQLNNAQTSAENASAIQNYNSFLSKYNTSENQLLVLSVSGQISTSDNLVVNYGTSTRSFTTSTQPSSNPTAKEAAEREATAKEKALSDAQTRSTGCTGIIISTSTATST